MRWVTATLAVAAMAVVLAGSASADQHYMSFGWALEVNGSRCGNDCTAFMQITHASDFNWTTSGVVSNGSATCAGTWSYNYGAPYANVPGFCTPQYNPGFNKDVGQVCGVIVTCTIYNWIRQGCGGGFRYSPTHSASIWPQSPEWYQTWYAGTLRLASGPCQPASITNAGLNAALNGSAP